MKYRAYHNEQSIKDFYLRRMIEHKEADNLVCKVDFEHEKNKGCAICCLFNDYHPYQTAAKLNIPFWVADLLTTLYRDMSENAWRDFPLKFLETIKVGQDLRKIKKRFFEYVLEFILDKFDHLKFPNVLKCGDDILDYYKTAVTTAEEYTKEKAAISCRSASAAYETKFLIEHEPGARAAYAAAQTFYAASNMALNCESVAIYWACRLDENEKLIAKRCDDFANKFLALIQEAKK